MTATSAHSSEIAVLTLSWINEQLLLELDRRIERELRRPASFWRRQAQAILSLIVCGVNLITLRAFA
ncbi:MAG: hypothetical protein SH850_27685 [Planctomycetaceae bacterium]|nr:hypothetical protein [Planctomycetaceae bacterium]